MITLHPELEALMPEPAFQLRWHDIAARYTVSMPNIGNTDVFTADQMREAIKGATERAAKLASDLAYDAAINYANGHAVDWDKAVGEAIRGGDGGGR